MVYIASVSTELYLTSFSVSMLYKKCLFVRIYCLTRIIDAAGLVKRSLVDICPHGCSMALAVLPSLMYPSIIHTIIRISALALVVMVGVRLPEGCFPLSGSTRPPTSTG